MATIDTLKLAHALRDKGGFSEEAAEGTAQALNEALGQGVATKADFAELRGEIKALEGRITGLDGKIAGLEGRIAGLESKVTMLMWVVGLNIAATIAVLVKHW